MAISERIFSFEDQEKFAQLSGDCNPMHMDALAARRTQAGAPVVHGMHLLLWSLNSVLRQHPEMNGIQKIRAQFQKFVLVGEQAAAEVVSIKGNTVRWVVSVDGGIRCKFVAHFTTDTQELLDSEVSHAPDEGMESPTSALELSLADLTNRTGSLRIPSAAAEGMARIYPAAAAGMGARRMASLALSSTLVGMVCPGLHSIYGELTVNAAPLDQSPIPLRYRVTETDARFRTVSMEIDGGGWTGNVEAFLRTPPVLQPSMDELRGRFAADQFQGVRALIVGGSRGLGELTAKLLATGGAETWITYRSGKADAENVAGEIVAAGGVCHPVQWDATEPAEKLLAQLGEVPTQVYYFATPTIFRPQARTYEPERLQSFLQVYVDGFWRLVESLRRINPEVRLYYPSSISVSDRPQGMTEYSMAKAAGEVLCADINEQLAPTRVVMTRLPRLATDQTASVTAVETVPAVDVMTEVICAMHA